MNDTDSRSEKSVSTALLGLTGSHTATSERLADAGIRSTFTIATTPAYIFLRSPMARSDAAPRALHEGATATAVAVARRFRERRLSAILKRTLGGATGIRSLVEGPTYEGQFQPSWVSNCMPDSLEATSGPIAYLAELRRKATLLEAEGLQTAIIPLSLRRPDLDKLVLNQKAAYQLKPTIVLVNEALEAAVGASLGSSGTSVDDALLQARYPFVLPHESYQAQINYLLGRKDYTLGDLVRLVDEDYPYFVRPGLHGKNSDTALQLDTGLGPVQQEILTEAPYAPDASSSTTRTNPRTLIRSLATDATATFLHRFYGVDNIADIVNVQAFCQRTGLNKDSLESLLSIERYAPIGSPHAHIPSNPTPSHFGSVYINAEGPNPIAVTTTSDDESHELTHLTHDRLDRIQRLVRLSRWLSLDFEQTDLLLHAAMKADRGASSLWPTDNTVRALGLFCRLRRDVGVTPEDFSALVGSPSVYARGENRPHFDRIFNANPQSPEPLVLDDTAFYIVPETEGAYRKIDRLCSALGMTFETYLYLARFIYAASAEAFDKRNDGEKESLTWSLDVLGSFYRLTRLPKYLGISPIEAVALLQILNRRGVQFIGRLAKSTLFVAQQSELSDTLTVVQALSDMVAWCRTNDLGVLWLHQQLTPIASVASATDTDVNLLTAIDARMRSTLVSEATFIESALPEFSGGDQPQKIRWMKELDLFIAETGLIREIEAAQDEEAYRTLLDTSIKSTLSALQLSSIDSKVKLLAIVLDAKAEQEALVWESLATGFQCTAEHSRELLRWSGGAPYTLLEEVNRVFTTNEDTSIPIRIGDHILTVLSRLAVRATISDTLSISAAALRAYVSHTEWFILGEAARDDEISFHTLHILAEYQHMLRVVRLDEQRVLDYFDLVHRLPTNPTESDWNLIREDAAGRIAQFAGFSIREVLETAEKVGSNGLVTTIPQLCRLLRLRGLCSELQIGTESLIQLAQLTPLSDLASYRTAAERAKALSPSHATHRLGDQQGEMGQSEWSSIVSDTEVIVAQSHEQAHFTLTVRNFLGQTLENVTVRWNTTLGELNDVDPVRTDERGQAHATLYAGDEMGVARLAARFGLDRQIVAPAVLIDCDDASLKIAAVAGMPEPIEALAGNLQQITYAISVRDRYGNAGRDRNIHWSSDLVSSGFLRPQTRTDENGEAMAFLRSTSEGEASVVALYPENGSICTFESVTFNDLPWFQHLRIALPIFENEPRALSARLMRLNGEPFENATVSFSDDPANGTFAQTHVDTDANGVAATIYTPAEVGLVTLAAEATTAEGTTEIATDPLNVFEAAEIVDWSPKGETAHIIGQPEPAAFSVKLSIGSPAIAVEWRKNGKFITNTMTGSDGVANLRHHFVYSDDAKTTVTASSASPPFSRDFDVAIESKPYQIEMIAESSNDLLIVPYPDFDTTGVYVRARTNGAVSKLKFRAFGGPSGDAGDEKAVFTATLISGEVTPSVFGVLVSPALGTPMPARADGTVEITVSGAHATAPLSAINWNTSSIRITTNTGVSMNVLLAPRLFSNIENSSAVVTAEDDWYGYYGCEQGVEDIVNISEIRVWVNHRPLVGGSDFVTSHVVRINGIKDGAWRFLTGMSYGLFQRSLLLRSDDTQVIFRDHAPSHPKSSDFRKRYIAFDLLD